MEELKQIPLMDDTMSSTIGELAVALAKAQGKLVGAIKDSSNPFFKSDYADLASVQEAIREPFSKHGLAYVQTTEKHPTDVVVITLLVHKSGEWIRGTINMTPQKNDPQGRGSCLTYCRRYALAAIAGISQVDDDANDASGKNGKKQEPKVVKPDPDALASLDEADSLETLQKHWTALTPKQRASVGKERLDGYKAKLK